MLGRRFRALKLWMLIRWFGVDGLRKRIRNHVALAQTFAAMAERPLPGEVLERAETRDLVHMAVANLPEQYKTALTRKYVDGESLETLAGELGISVDATKSLLARARRAFRDTFATLSANLSEVA